MDQTDLPAYESIIANLTDKLGGLSTVHEGLGEAALSLTVVHQELSQTKAQLEQLLGSTQAMLNQVERLQPAEFVAFLDKRLATVSQESSGSFAMLGERVAEVRHQLETVQRQNQDGLATLEHQLTAQSSAVPAHFSAVEHALNSGLATTEHTFIEYLTTFREDVRNAIAAAADHQETRAETIAALIQRVEKDLAQRHDILESQIAATQRKQTEFANKLIALDEATHQVRSVGAATQTIVFALREQAIRLPATTSSLIEGVKQDMATQARNIQWRQTLQLIASVLILLLLALQWINPQSLLPGA